jgi:hypothetical protein
MVCSFDADRRPLRKAAIGAGDDVLATLVSWLMTPGISLWPGASLTIFHACQP